MTDRPAISDPGGRPGDHAALQGDAAPAATLPLRPARQVPVAAALSLNAVVAALVLAGLVSGVVLGAVFVATLAPGPGVVALACFVAAAWLHFVVRAHVHDGRTRRAILSACVALVGVAIVAGLSLPDAIGVAVTLPLLAAAIVLPFSDRSTFLMVVGVAWVTEVVIGLAEELGPPVSAGASSVPAVLRVMGLAFGAALVLIVLWKTSRAITTPPAAEPDAAAAASTAAVEEELRRRVGELELRSQEMTQLAKLADLLQACVTAAEAYTVITQTAGPLFAGDSGVLYELTESRTAVEQVAAWGENSSSMSVFGPTECWALRRGRVYLVEDSGTELLCQHVGDAAPPGYLCVPLTAQSETFGLLHIEIGYKVPREKRAAHLADRLRLAVTLSEHLSLALANFRLRATLRERSTRDELTGLFNRRYMEDSLDREIRRATRDGESLGVLMLDLDHFKRLNDAFGHAAGDFALRLVGQFLQSSIRGEDVACRFGGEEFVVILPKAGVDDTRRRGEALRLGIRHLRADHGGPSFPTLTMSIGVAAYPQHGSTGEALLSASDEALYRAKAEGRDRVVVAGTGESRAIEVGPA